MNIVEHSFWSAHFQNDIIATILLFGLLLVGFIVYKYPSFTSYLLEPLLSRKQQELSTHIHIKIPSSYFSTGGVLFSISLLALTLYLWGIDTPILQLGVSIEGWLRYGALWLLLFISYIARIIDYRLSIWVYLPAQSLPRLKTTYILLLWLWSLSLIAPIFFLAWQETRWIGKILFLSLFALWRLLLLLRTAPIILAAIESRLMFFLYLCAHEVAPCVVLYQVVSRYLHLE